ncbi:sigma-70 family RNA polymerase sigma factor [Sphingomonas sp. PL-96]|uniref:RNA polymerase sigma factor n=1 Tax=Sphingomonas sp. PL-96 TaxID=2887201 RepID=UPI001E50C6E2|nr:sigma-70 family RNA polymerase sigma factor [Sphingomonas sp. PL-96]MCC2977125.1 sigma-70 family RNA polymerase sigma factor [Sphingomonas sp. PL-96]
MTDRGSARRTPVLGEDRFVERLYAAEAPRLVRTRHPRSAREERVDLVHDAFVRLLALGPERLRVLATQRPAAYLGRIARHVGLDQARRESRRSSTLHLSIDDAELRAADLERQLEARDELRRVERAVATMRPRTRAIFLAHRVDGMSYAEIARECGIGVKGVEKQMSRAIAILARELDKDGDA